MSSTKAIKASPAPSAGLAVLSESAPSPQATAAALSALVISEQYGDSTLATSQAELLDTAYRGDLSELLLSGLRWLANSQNADGGWGPVVGGDSNLVTSLLVQSAFRLTCVPAADAEREPRLERFLRNRGGAAALRRTTLSRGTLSAVLTNCAAAGVIAWNRVPVIRLEKVAAPAWVRHFLGAPQFDPEDPVVLASGLARLHRVRQKSFPLNWVRSSSAGRCLERIAGLQEPGGGFNGSVIATGFIVSALASAGLASHPVVRKGVEFLLCSVGPDASWPTHYQD